MSSDRNEDFKNAFKALVTEYYGKYVGLNLILVTADAKQVEDIENIDEISLHNLSYTALPEGDDNTTAMFSSFLDSAIANNEQLNEIILHNAVESFIHMNNRNNAFNVPMDIN